MQKEGVLSRGAEHEIEQQYFDQLSVVRHFESDIANYGQVLPGTRERYLNEEVTYVAEAIDAPLRSPYPYYFDGQSFANTDGGRLDQILDNGVVAAEAARNLDARKEFEYQRALIDQQRHDELVDFMTSDSDVLLVVSAFPEETAVEHGTDFIESIGYQPKRALAFLRVYQKIDEETLQETCISVDSSNLALWNQLLAEYGQAPAATTEQLLARTHNIALSGGDVDKFVESFVDSYDQALMQRNPDKQYKQGREISDVQPVIDSWEFVNENHDLVAGQIDLLEAIAQTRLGFGVSHGLEQFLVRSSNVDSRLPVGLKKYMNQALRSPEALLDDETAIAIRKAITYMFAANMRARYEELRKGAARVVRSESDGVSFDELLAATEQAIRNMEQFIGCGGVQDMFEFGSIDQMREEGLRGSEQYTYDRITHCVSCDPKAKKRPVACGPCNICWRCDVESSRIGGSNQQAK